MVAISIRPLTRIASVCQYGGGGHPHVLFCFYVIVHLKDVYLERLLMIAHVTEDHGLGLVKWRVCPSCQRQQLVQNLLTDRCQHTVPGNHAKSPA